MLYLSHSCILELELQLPLLAAVFACSAQFHDYQLNSPKHRNTNYVTFTFASFIPQEIRKQSFVARCLLLPPLGMKPFC